MAESSTKAKRAKQAVSAIVEELVAEKMAEEDQKDEIRTPGSIIGKGTGNPRKIAYTMKDLEQMFNMVTFTPEETIPVNFGGVRVLLVADQEVTLPEVFKGIYEDHRKSLRKPEVPPGVNFVPGGGGLSPEPTREV